MCLANSGPHGAPTVSLAPRLACRWWTAAVRAIPLVSPVVVLVGSQLTRPRHVAGRLQPRKREQHVQSLLLRLLGRWLPGFGGRSSGLVPAKVLPASAHLAQRGEGGDGEEHDVARIADHPHDGDVTCVVCPGDGE